MAVVGGVVVVVLVVGVELDVCVGCVLVGNCTVVLVVLCGCCGPQNKTTNEKAQNKTRFLAFTFKKTSGIYLSFKGILATIIQDLEVFLKNKNMSNINELHVVATALMNNGF